MFTATDVVSVTYKKNDCSHRLSISATDVVSETCKKKIFYMFTATDVVSETCKKIDFFSEKTIDSGHRD